MFRNYRERELACLSREKNQVTTETNKVCVRMRNEKKLTMKGKRNDGRRLWIAGVVETGRRVCTPVADKSHGGRVGEQDWGPGRRCHDGSELASPRGGEG